MVGFKPNIFGVEGDLSTTCALQLPIPPDLINLSSKWC